jgi:hypothetical protein
MTLREAIILIILGAWLAATLLYQIFIIRLRPYTWRWDVFRVLPSYHLFAAVPRDFRLSYRDCLINGELTPWREIALFSSWHWRHAFWHPGQLAPGVLSSLVENLVESLEDWETPPGEEKIARWLDHQGLLHYVRFISTSANAKERQFRIEETGGHLDSRPIREWYCSPFYPL